MIYGGPYGIWGRGLAELSLSSTGGLLFLFYLLSIPLYLSSSILSDPLPSSFLLTLLASFLLYLSPHSFFFFSVLACSRSFLFFFFSFLCPSPIRSIFRHPSSFPNVILQYITLVHPHCRASLSLIHPIISCLVFSLLSSLFSFDLPPRPSCWLQSPDSRFFYTLPLYLLSCSTASNTHLHLISYI